MISVLYAFFIITGLGILLGAGLAVADKKLSVKKDERLEELESAMPGANCGGCGFAGCSAYAEAVFTGGALPGLCAPGGQALSDKMCSILGLESSRYKKKVAFVFCQGDCTNTSKDYVYHGLSDCNAASILFKGDGSCKYGCLHLGSCISVCTNSAISRDVNGKITVDSSKCTGCGKCASVCPNSVIRLIDADTRYVVACNSHDKGVDVRKKCNVGCIGCKICETKYPESGFKVDNFLAFSDNSASLDKQKEAYIACPRKAIVMTGNSK